mmetsp:Transcript_31014/g.75333  ORF Transcript_31014/g.75333 Transcript_31014/m.75333 type:complete len:289 (+) Transcript_31014:1669-2535(+)
MPRMLGARAAPSRGLLQLKWRSSSSRRARSPPPAPRDRARGRARARALALGRARAPSRRRSPPAPTPPARVPTRTPTTTTSARPSPSTPWPPSRSRSVRAASRWRRARRSRRCGVSFASRWRRSAHTRQGSPTTGSPSRSARTGCVCTSANLVGRAKCYAAQSLRSSAWSRTSMGVLKMGRWFCNCSGQMSASTMTSCSWGTCCSTLSALLILPERCMLAPTGRWLPCLIRSPTSPRFPFLVWRSRRRLVVGDCSHPTSCAPWTGTRPACWRLRHCRRFHFSSRAATC